MESRKNTDGGAGHSVPPGAAASTQHTGVSARTFAAGTVNVYQGAPPAESGATAGPRCDIPVLYDRDFIGRVDLLSAIAETLDDPQRPSVVALHGTPGVGKTELAHEYARRHAKRYPAGCFTLDAGGDTPVKLAEIGRLIFGPEPFRDLPMVDQCKVAFHRLTRSAVLLVYDNVRSADAIRPWLPPHGTPCHVIMTSVLDPWDGLCPAFPVELLDRDDSVALVASIAGEDACRDADLPLVDWAGGLPVQLVPAAAALKRARRRGRAGATKLRLEPETQNSFRPVYELLPPDSRLILQTAALRNGMALMAEDLRQDMEDATGWAEDSFDRHLDACLDLHLLESGGETLRMHQLIAAFLRDQPAPDGHGETLTRIRQTQWSRLVDSAEAFADAPNRMELAAGMLGFLTDPALWDGCGVTGSALEYRVVCHAFSETAQFGIAQLWAERSVYAVEQEGAEEGVDNESLSVSLHEIGNCLFNQGRFAEAQPWFEKAVDATQKGDIHQRIDHQSLGASLHQIGSCLFNQGRFAEAQPWFEKAVDATRKGDIHQRVDHQSLGASQHQIGSCLFNQGRFAEAQPWFEKAVDATQKGDTHQRIDHESLSASLHEIGNCLFQQGCFAEAQPWFEKAVDAAQKGDIHQRIDHRSLGVSLHQIGSCLFNQGRFAEAQPWFEKAVDATQKGDIHQRINHQSLGASLHEIGNCLFQQGCFAEAQPWFEKAVDAAQKGDIHQRIDHRSLGVSLHEIGNCLYRQGYFAEAQPWYKKAVDAMQKGDIHQRIDHRCFGISLKAVGHCLSRLGREDEAQQWYERAKGLKPG
ncbi:tetratricopeptide repeat protein [Azospirillum sp. B2RO_4]|uniref:tetratricopeptide repeat protein n=1 Tax=Azospirillum sp. B2RO_4 TaxID=3027796 RepID=UPI003DA9ED59